MYHRIADGRSRQMRDHEQTKSNVRVKRDGSASKLEAPHAATSSPHPLVRLHHVIVPLFLFWWFFSLPILDPTNVGWLNGDLAVSFLGWTAFRFSHWAWPLGMSSLIAYPHGMPVIATDSNPLLSILLKPFSGLLPHPFQFAGIWYLLSLYLSYNIAFGLIRRLTGRYAGAIFGAALIAAAPIFVWRWGHNSLTSQWLILASFSVFMRKNSERACVAKHSGLHALAAAIHPYFLAMIFPIAGMDLARGSYHRLRTGRSFPSTLVFLTVGVGAIALSVLLVAWITGMLELTRIGGGVGIYSMDPLAWFNPLSTSLFLPSWAVGPGQHEGYQYLGLGGLFLIIGSAAILMFSRQFRPAPLKLAMLWLIPAFVIWYMLALSPVITVFGHVLLAIDTDRLPVANKIFSAFRSSGRIGWPITYFLLLFGVCGWLSSRVKGAQTAVCIALILQLVDMSPLAHGVRAATSQSGRLLPSLDIAAWRPPVEKADFIYLDPIITNDHPLLYTLGFIAFPMRIPINRYYFAQGMTTRAEAKFNDAEDATVLAGSSLRPNGLYIVGEHTLNAWISSQAPALSRVLSFENRIVVPPAGLLLASAKRLRFAMPPSDTSLYGLVRDCGKGCTLALAVRDDATVHLSPDFIRLLDSRGGNIGRLKYRGSYAALLVDGRVMKEEISPNKEVVVHGASFGIPISVISGGNNATDVAKIVFDDIDLSPDSRGINVVELKNGGIAYSGSYDTNANAKMSAAAGDVLKCPPVMAGVRVLLDQSALLTRCILTSGWSGPEAWGTWSEGKTAKLRIKLERPLEGDAKIEIAATAFGRSTVQNIAFDSDGRPIATISLPVREKDEISLLVPHEAIQNGTIELTAHIGDPVSPKELGGSDDSRQLGFAVMSLRVDPVPAKK
ncbi:MAG TPA: DUF6311 domain-containing protein [Rhizobiaceae bacterium]|nr:DUF6311 domain-containing protein [Rhizobiaceae bacterium]